MKDTYIKFESGLSNAQIANLADSFAKTTNFTPGDDITKFVKSIGGKIKYDNTHLDIWGSGIKVNGPKDFTIYLTTFIPELYDNYLIAHCIGHFVLHSQLGKYKLETETRHRIDSFEKEANSFACQFLMPKDKVLSMYKDNNNLFTLAEYFNVPLSHIVSRLNGLGVYV